MNPSSGYRNCRAASVAVTALASVSLSSRAGRSTASSAQNGAGKTTLIKTLGSCGRKAARCAVFGLDPVADSGAVLSGSATSPRKTTSRRMRVDELIRYSARVLSAWDDVYAEELRLAFALDSRGEIKNLSKGQKARVGCSSRWHIGRTISAG